MVQFSGQIKVIGCFKKIIENLSEFTPLNNFENASMGSVFFKTLYYKVLTLRKK